MKTPLPGCSHLMKLIIALLCLRTVLADKTVRFERMLPREGGRFDLGDFFSDLVLHYPGGGQERLKVRRSSGKVRIESAREIFQMAFDDIRVIVSDGNKVLAAGKGMCLKYEGGLH